jgi:hypothetical protein
VTLSDGSDWLIDDDGRLLGGHNLHVLRNRMTENERRQFYAQLGLAIGDRPEVPYGILGLSATSFHPGILGIQLPTRSPHYLALPRATPGQSYGAGKLGYKLCR